MGDYFLSNCKLHLNIFSIVECTGDLVGVGNNHGNYSFQWSCPRPDPKPLKAKVALSPEPGHLDVEQPSQTLICTMSEAFPRPTSDIIFENQSGKLSGKDTDTYIGSDGYVKVTNTYKIQVIDKNANFTVVVTQDGFDNQTFAYNVTYPDGKDGNGSIGISRTPALLILFFLLISLLN